METLNSVLPIFIYFSLIILIVVVIILGIKLIIVLGKVETTIDDVNKKLRSVDKVFEIVDYATGKLSVVTDSLVSFLTGLIAKIFNNKKIKEDK